MQLSKHGMVAAGGAFLALFGAVCFLLGRESVRRRPARAAVAPVTTVEVAPLQPPAWAAAPPTPPPTPTPPTPPMPSTDMTLSAPRPAARPAEPSAPVPPMPSFTDDRPRVADGATEVRDYFTRMQAIQAVAPSNDPSEFANKLLSSSITGDTSGLDELVRVAEAGADRARSVTPPAACADYHQRMLGMLGESVVMVRQLKAALSSNDASALTALAASGSSLQSRTSALEQQAQQIKSRYGLAR